MEDIYGARSADQWTLYRVCTEFFDASHFSANRGRTNLSVSGARRKKTRKKKPETLFPVHDLSERHARDASGTGTGRRKMRKTKQINCEKEEEEEEVVVLVVEGRAGEDGDQTNDRQRHGEKEREGTRMRHGPSTRGTPRPCFHASYRVLLGFTGSRQCSGSSLVYFPGLNGFHFDFFSLLVGCSRSWLASIVLWWVFMFYRVLLDFYYFYDSSNSSRGLNFSWILLSFTALNGFRCFSFFG